MQRARKALVPIAMLAALAAVFMLQRYLVGRWAKTPPTLAEIAADVLPSFALWALFSPAIVALTRRYELAGARWLRNASIHLVACCVFFLVDVVGFELINPPPPGQRVAAALYNIWFDFVLYAVIAGVAQVVASRDRAHREQLHAEALSRQLAETRLRALQLQLQPHFLFNALNSVSELMHEDVARADQMLTQVADLLRASLRADAQVVTLADELRLVDTYLRIQQTRFSDRLTFAVDADPEALEARVPTFLLQPLVENAVRHGIAPRAARGRVAVRCTRENGLLRIDVTDDGVGLPATVKEGVGLKATRERLAELYQGKSKLALTPVATGGTRTTLTLPFDGGR